MKQWKQHKEDHHQSREETGNVTQDVNHSALGELDEEALNQATGGGTASTTSWKTLYTLPDGSKMTISPDGKSFTYHGAILPNGTVHTV